MPEVRLRLAPSASATLAPSSHGGPYDTSILRPARAHSARERDSREATRNGAPRRAPPHPAGPRGTTRSPCRWEQADRRSWCRSRRRRNAGVTRRMHASCAGDSRRDGCEPSTAHGPTGWLAGRADQLVRPPRRTGRKAVPRVCGVVSADPELGRAVLQRLTKGANNQELWEVLMDGLNPDWRHDVALVQNK